MLTETLNVRRTNKYDAEFDARVNRFLEAHRVRGPLMRAEAIAAVRKDWAGNLEPGRLK